MKTTFKRKTLAMLLCLMMLVQALAVGFTVNVSAADDGVKKNLEPYQISGVAAIHNGDYNKRFSMMGIDYLYGVSIARDNYWSEGAEMLFNLGGNTEVLTFDIGNIDGSGQDSVMLQFYCDNNFLTEIELTYNMPTYHYVLNVKGTTQLKVAMKEAKQYFSFGIANITGYTAEAAANAGITVPTKSSFQAVYNSNLTDKAYLSPYQTAGVAAIHNGDYNNKITMMGKDYFYGISLSRDNYWSEGAEMLFNLGGDFKKIDFTIGNIDGSGHDPITLQIYKDGIFFTEIEFKYDMPTYHYEINVSGTNQLRFVMKEAKQYFSFAIVDIIGHLNNESCTVPETFTRDLVIDTNYDDATEHFYPYQTEENANIYRGDINNTFSIMGTQYAYGLTIARDNYWSGGAEFLFNFGGMYHTMTFTVGHIDNAGADSVTLQVFKNGEFSEEIELTSNMIAMNYTIDLNGVNQLKIAMKEAKQYYGYGLANIKVDGLGIGTPNRFSDIKYGQWYYNGVMYAYQNGYMKGTNTDMTLFSPNMQFTREQFVQLLFNMEGLNAADYSGSTGFTDVPAGKWYSAAVKWAKEAGVTSGIGGGAFGLGGSVSREQLAQFLKNYAEMKGYSTAGRVDINSFNDCASVSGWATEAVSWAVSIGLLGSTSSTEKVLSPARVAIRSEIAKVTMSFDENVR